MKKMNFKMMMMLMMIMLVKNTSGRKDDDDLETHSDDDNMNDDNKKSWCILPPNFLINYSAFSYDITAAILVFQTMNWRPY